MSDPLSILRKRAEFLAANKGLRNARVGFVLLTLPNAGAGKRFGVTVTKKIGNAVVRNRTRRRLKEAARLEFAIDPVAGLDLVLIGREGTRARAFPDLRDDLRRALRKAGVIRPVLTPPVPTPPVLTP
jgi:ribonuclease P protein component